MGAVRGSNIENIFDAVVVDRILSGLVRGRRAVLIPTAASMNGDPKWTIKACIIGE